MKKQFIYFLILFFNNTNSINIYQKHLLDHVALSISNAEKHISKLTQEILDLNGMSSAKVRHLLNNICSLKNGKYLEIGTWKGSTFVSALYGNSTNLIKSYGIDNWSQFNGPRNEFLINVNKFLNGNDFEIFENDSFKVDLRKINKGINIYFYDGHHSFESHKLAFTYFNEILANDFIVIIDDYNEKKIQKATQEVLKELKYNILFEKVLSSPFNCDINSWWNGIYIAVISKQ